MIFKKYTINQNLQSEKEDRRLLNAAKEFIIISTFMPVYDMLPLYLEFMTKIRANKKSS